MKKPRLLRAGYFLWLLGPLAAFYVYAAHGLPHAIWSYNYLGGQHGQPRFYTQCTFIGPLGAFTIPAKNGRCGWLLFRKDKSGSAQ